MAEIKQETGKDQLLQTVTELVHTGKWHTAPDTCKTFIHVKSELSVNDTGDILLHGSRIVVPAALQQRVLHLAHEGHQGIVKTKALLCEKVWFPLIDQRIETMIKTCLACQATTPEARPCEPLCTGQMPQQPWTHLAADFYGPVNNTDLLVVVDKHSHCPVVETCSSTSVDAVIPILDKLFCNDGQLTGAQNRQNTSLAE